MLEAAHQSLRQALLVQQQTSKQLAALAAEQSKQIRMVVEERFYRPIISPADHERQKSEVRVEPDELNDVAQFSEEGDQTQMATEDQRGREIDRKLDEAFELIQADHQKAHQVPA